MSGDLSVLPLEQLRSRRNELQRLDDSLSYVRRVAQARLDLVDAELRHRFVQARTVELSAELREVLSSHLTFGAARPPRPTDGFAGHPAIDELEHLCRAGGFDRLDELNQNDLSELRDHLAEFEGQISADRRRRFDHIDALSAELIRRYRTGEASVDSLLAER